LKNCDAAFAIKVTKGCQDPINITIKVVYTNCAVFSKSFWSDTIPFWCLWCWRTIFVSGRNL